MKPTLKMKHALSLLAALLFAPLAVYAIAPTSLKTEFLENPLGIDAAKPRFSWIVEDTTPGARQTAYQIQAASSPETLAKESADLWDSGRVASDETVGIEYAGDPLTSRSVCWWRVKVWDGAGKESGWSTPAMFSVGLLAPQDWQAKWIGVPPDNSVPPHFGFRSQEADSENEVKWVQVDLGKVQHIDGFKLWGGWPSSPYSPPGDGFPVRFKIEVAMKDDFSDASVVVDRTDKDFFDDLMDIGTNPVSLTCQPVDARYVRLTATKLSGCYEGGQWNAIWCDVKQRHAAIPSSRRNQRGGWKLALAEMEIFSGKKNVALGAKVTASDAFEDAFPGRTHSYEREGWKREFLTDGRTEGTAGTLWSPQPVPLLRQTFKVDKPVRRAMLYSTALGNYEVRINGAKVGDHKLAPGWVNYSKRVLYQTHDVTELLRPGSNAVGALLADGWYRLRTRTDSYGSAQRLLPETPARFLCQLEIEYEDGSRETVATDGSWQCAIDGPLRYASMFDGITYDARKEILGWDLPVKPDGEWEKVSVDPAVKIELTAQMHEPVRVLQVIAPVKMDKPKPGVKIYDFGTSMAGFCRVTLDGQAGTEVSLRYAEALRPDGTLYVANLNGSYDNANRYILDGKGERTFEPDFTYHGFRYVEVTGDLSAIREIVACDISTDMRQIGYFESSDSRLNKLCSIVERAYRSNCPSTTVDVAGRDERQSWMGDCFTDEVQSLAYLFGSAGLIANTVRGVYDGMNKYDLPGDHATKGREQRNWADAGWADAGITGTWAAWVNFADQRTLEQGYESTARYMDAVAAKSKDGLPGENYDSHFGDWLSNRMTIKPGAASWREKGGMGAPCDLFAATMWAHAVDLTAQMANALGKDDDARRWEGLLKTIRAAIVKKYVRPDGTVEGGTPDKYAPGVNPMAKQAGGDEQSSYALMLGLGHLDGVLREKALQRLLEAIRKQDGHFGTGSFTTTYLLRCLADTGLQNLAYEMVMKPTCPSYGFMVDNGATAMWERWDSYHPQLGFNPEHMNGLNHLGMNSVYEWIFGTIAGIRPDPEHPGYKHFFIEPKPPQGLEWVKARYDSARGPIGVEWNKEEGGLNLKVSVPPNTTATVKFPDGRAEEVAAGKHQFMIQAGQK